MTFLRQNRELKRLGIWNWSLPAFAGKLHNVVIIGVGVYRRRSFKREPRHSRAPRSAWLA
ncbi:hypothetical protein OG570_40520 [Amycolatopsis sp. NBC_01286]|nr:hypothetical protein OG570_40520 [Amycolatopsis sp. NBC_01286]